MFRGQGNDGFEIEAGEEGHLRRSGTGGAVDAWFDYGEEGGDLNEGLGGGFVCHGSLRGGQGSSMYVCCCGDRSAAPLETQRPDRDSGDTRRVDGDYFHHD